MQSRVILVFSLCVLFFASTVIAGSPKKYGKRLTLKAKTNISEILAAPDNYDGKKVLVEGAVVDVCEKRGCWIVLGSDKEFESIIFKVDDGVITFPMSAKGKTARAQGVVSVTTLSKEDCIEREKYLLRAEYPERKHPARALELTGWALWMALQVHRPARLGSPLTVR